MSSPRWTSLLVAEIFYPDTFLEESQGAGSGGSSIRDPVAGSPPPVHDFQNYQQYLQKRANTGGEARNSGSGSGQQQHHCDGVDEMGCFQVSEQRRVGLVQATSLQTDPFLSIFIVLLFRYGCITTGSWYRAVASAGDRTTLIDTYVAAAPMSNYDKCHQDGFSNAARLLLAILTSDRFERRFTKQRSFTRVFQAGAVQDIVHRYLNCCVQSKC